MRFVALWICMVAMLVVAVGEAADIKTITHGKRVDLKEHLVEGKYVVVDFYADWCGGCRQVEPILARLAGKHEDRLALRKVDVVQWGSPVASQFNIASLPYLELYDPNGKRLAAGGASQVILRLERELRKEPVSSSMEAATTATPAASSSGRGPLFVALLLVALVAAAKIGVLPLPLARTGDGASSIRWYVERHGAFEGPYSSSQLRDMRRKGDVAGDTPVCRKTDAERMTVTEALS